MSFFNPFKKKVVPPSTGRQYGWKPDLPDHRDLMYGALVQAPVKLPPSTDLRKLCPPVQDQGQLGSCTAHALTGALGTLENIDKKTQNIFSRLFVYYNERALERTVGYDSGAALRDGIKTLAAQGCCLETLWPYNINVFTRKPASSCYTDGLKRKITAYYRILNLTQMKSCLASGYPFVFGFTVYESFESDTVASTGVVPMPSPSEQVLGGHAVLAVGYDDATSRFLVRNSWGTSWGMQGYFTIPYAYVSNSNLADDFWYVKSGLTM